MKIWIDAQLSPAIAAWINRKVLKEVLSKLDEGEAIIEISDTTN